MARPASAALRSYLPESRLVQQRDNYALWFKYLTQFPGGNAARRWSLFRFERECLRPNDTSVYEPFKQLGGIAVRGDERCPATGDDITDDSFFRIYQGTKNVVMLHVTEISGIHGAREDLSQAAEYIKSHDTLRYRRHVVGLTYSEMARLAVRAGFRSLEVAGIDVAYDRSIQAAHQVFCAFSGVERDYEPAMVYLPTEEFVDTFAASAAKAPSLRA